MDCLGELEIYRKDFASIAKFFDKSDLTRKLNGFIESMKKKQTEESKTESIQKSTLYSLREFIRVLSFSPSDGKLLLHFHDELGQRCKLQ